MGCIISCIFHNFIYPPINDTTRQIFNKDLNITLRDVIVSTYEWMEDNGGVELIYPREFYVQLENAGMCEYIYAHSHITPISRVDFIDHFKNKFIDDNSELALKYIIENVAQLVFGYIFNTFVPNNIKYYNCTD